MIFCSTVTCQDEHFYTRCYFREADKILCTVYLLVLLLKLALAAFIFWYS